MGTTGNKVRTTASNAVTQHDPSEVRSSRTAGIIAAAGSGADAAVPRPIRRRRHLWLVPPLLARLVAVMTVALVAPVRGRKDAGMTTAEYAVGTIAACGFAAILYQVVTGQSIITALSSLISRALASL